MPLDIPSLIKKYDEQKKSFNLATTTEEKIRLLHELGTILTDLLLNAGSTWLEEHRLDIDREVNWLHETNRHYARPSSNTLRLGNYINQNMISAAFQLFIALRKVNSLFTLSINAYFRLLIEACLAYQNAINKKEQATIYLNIAVSLLKDYNQYPQNESQHFFSIFQENCRKKRIDPRIINAMIKSLLHIVVSMKETPTFSVDLIKGLSINTFNEPDSNGDTLLMIAARTGSKAMFIKLLEMGEDYSKINNRGETVSNCLMLFYSDEPKDIHNNRREKLVAFGQWLKDKKKKLVQFPKNAVHQAAIMGDGELIFILVEELNIPIDTRDDFGRTALHMAYMFSHQEAVDLLLGLGANARAKDDNGICPGEGKDGNIPRLSHYFRYETSLKNSNAIADNLNTSSYIKTTSKVVPLSTPPIKLSSSAHIFSASLTSKQPPRTFNGGLGKLPVRDFTYASQSSVAPSASLPSRPMPPKIPSVKLFTAQNSASNSASNQIPVMPKPVPPAFKRTFPSATRNSFNYSQNLPLKDNSTNSSSNHSKRPLEESQNLAPPPKKTDRNFSNPPLLVGSPASNFFTTSYQPEILTYRREDNILLEFTVHDVPHDGDCGFHILPLPTTEKSKRQQVKEQLLSYKYDPHIRELVWQEIYDEVISGMGSLSRDLRSSHRLYQLREAYFHNQTERDNVTREIFRALEGRGIRDLPLERHAESLEQYLRFGHTDFGLNENDRRNYFNRLQSFLNNLKSSEIRLIQCCKEEQTFEDFVNDYVGGRGHLAFFSEKAQQTSTVDALAYINSWRIEIFQKLSNNSLKSVKVCNPNGHIKVYMLHDGGHDTHFRILERFRGPQTIAENSSTHSHTNPPSYSRPGIT